MAQEVTKKGCVAIVGAGPGLGRSLAMRFAKGGYNLALISRSKTSTEPLAKEISETHKNIKTFCVAVETQEEDIKKAHKEIQTALGDVEVLCYNASAGFNKKSITEVTQEEMLSSFAVTCVGAAMWSKFVVPAMIQNQKGTILFTGATASMRGGALLTVFACAKWGLRALSQSMARELGPKGIHVAHVVVDGVIFSKKTEAWLKEKNQFMDPNDMAESFWALHVQPSSAWTQELDLRPFCEKF